MAALSPSIGYDPEKFGTGNQPELGKYHFIIADASEPDKGGTAKVKLQVLAGTVPKQEGKTIDDFYFPFSEKAADRLKHLFWITKVATLEQINSGEDIPMKSLIGKQLVGEVVMQEASTGIDKKTGLPKTFPAKKALGYRMEEVGCKSNGWDKVPRDERALSGDFGFQDTPLSNSQPGDQDAGSSDSGADAGDTGFNFG